MTEPATTADEGAEILLLAVLSEFNDLPDEELVDIAPVLRLIGRELGVSHARVPDELVITVDELRQRTRAALGRLAAGDQ